MNLHPLPLVAILAFTFSCTRLDTVRTRRMAEADLFEPQRTPVRPEISGRRNVEVALPDGNVLRGILAARRDPKFNIVYFGGGSEIAQAAAPRLAQWAVRYDANVAFMDYRGYGASSGVPSLQTLPSDALPVFDRISGLSAGVPTIAIGFAIGSVPATFLAARRPVAGLVLVAPVSSPDDEEIFNELSKRKSGDEPWFLTPFVPLVKTKPGFDVPEGAKPMLQIRQVTAPLLVIHGEADGTVPPRCGRKVYESAPGSKTMLMVPGVGHDAPSLLGGPGAEAFARFVSECLGSDVGAGEDIVVEEIGGPASIGPDLHEDEGSATEDVGNQVSTGSDVHAGEDVIAEEIGGLESLYSDQGEDEDIVVEEIDGSESVSSEDEIIVEDIGSSDRSHASLDPVPLAWSGTESTAKTARLLDIR